MGTANGRVSAVKRLANTKAGNPRYSVTLNGGFTFVTEPDTHIAGSLHDGLVGLPVELTLNPSGRITDVAVRRDPTQYVVGVGEHASEWVLYGPFSSLAEAHLWAERYALVTVLPLHAPYEEVSS